MNGLKLPPSGIPKLIQPVRAHRNISNISYEGGDNATVTDNSFDTSVNATTVSLTTTIPSTTRTSQNDNDNDNDNNNTMESNANSNHSTTSGITYRSQDALPPLPVPTLEETMDKFLKLLEAVEADNHDPEERRETERVVREFLTDPRRSHHGNPNGSFNSLDGGRSANNTTGPLLQELLLEYDKTGRQRGSIGSYVEEFWSDAYLAPDASVVLNLNPYFLLEESPDPKLAGNQILRASSLCFASIKMASQLRNEDLNPDTFKGRTLCMNQFRALFGASRVPMRSTDTIKVFENPNHVAVMCCNQLFHFQALWPNGDVAVDEEDLVHILEAIKDHAHKLERTGDDANCGSNGEGLEDDENAKKYVNSVSAIGVLTSLGRKQWATAREEIIKYSPVKNSESFEIVDSALFVLVLDDFVPKNKDEAAANMLHGSYELSEWKTEGYAYANEFQSGSCTNRWYDKLQIIVTANGGAGINFEHSAIDGHTALRFVSDIYAETVIAFAQSITKMVQAHRGLDHSLITAKVRRAANTLDGQGNAALDVFPKKINFHLSNAIKRKIYFAETALGDQILASDTRILEFTDYGKQFITFNKMSPDSYVQMSMMLAYYRLYGKIVCAYEPVLTKGFFHGRTEAMRPATMEAKHLCEMFCDVSSTPEQKLTALQDATRAHSKLVRECAQGKGVDRHLFALKCIAKKNKIPVPEFFRSEAWKRFNHTILSTSNCGNPSLAAFGFGPVVSDGYGIGYIIKDSRLHYAISSKHRQTTRYALTLEGILREMASILKPISNTKVIDDSSTKKLFSEKMSADTIWHDSYVDLWGESSFQSSVYEGRPKSIDEKAERRWSAEIKLDEEEIKDVGGDFDASASDIIGPSDGVGVQDSASPPTNAKPNDLIEQSNMILDEAKNNRSEGRKVVDQTRHESLDHIPIMPNRRCSASITLAASTKMDSEITSRSEDDDDTEPLDLVVLDEGK